ncbi:hypothetical protein VitviT2T_010728 [Vitis vinifera]|uniref:Cyclin N-terminal domain-containing protein n=2 Tax=Vitis vinifera TaxID=29760 RepID=A0ABY9C9G9_VITVI|eukprot:XP_010646327.1 PREDICTED: cyclin-D4-2 [Vitis vinifera]
MGSGFDYSVSSLLCSETHTVCFDDLDCNAIDEFFPWNFQNHYQNPIFRNSRSESWIECPMLSEERLREMVEREGEYMPRDDYLGRLRSGDLDLGVRREAVDWILKAHACHGFGPLSLYLSINFLDRVLSVYQLPTRRPWIVRLLSVACLSVAAKVEETNVPLSIELQEVGDPRLMFEAKTIRRMELLVLTHLKWKMQAFTPCSFIDYFLSKVNDHKYPSGSLISRSIQLILSTIKGIDFLEFKASEIAAAVAICVSEEIQDIDKAMSCLIHVDEGRVLKCVQLIQNAALLGASTEVAGASAASVPLSPVGVLDAACWSYKSDDLTVGSCANSSHNTPDGKRRKLERPSGGGDF